MVIPFYAVCDSSLDLNDLIQFEADPIVYLDYSLPPVPVQRFHDMDVQIRVGRPPHPWNVMGEATESGDRHISLLVNLLNVRAYEATCNLAFVIDAACKDNELLQKARSLNRMSYQRIHRSNADYIAQVGVLWASRRALYLHFKRMGALTRRNLHQLLPNWQAGSYRTAHSPGKISSMKFPASPKWPLPEVELLRGITEDNGTQIPPPPLGHIGAWRRMCDVGGIHVVVYPWLLDDRVPSPSQLDFYNRVMRLAQFTMSREEQIAAVQSWRLKTHQLIRAEQLLARYWPDSFRRNQKMYISDLNMRQDENRRFCRLLRICHPCLSPRLAALLPGGVPYSNESLPHARASSSISPSRASTGAFLAVVTFASAHNQVLSLTEPRVGVVAATEEGPLEGTATSQLAQLPFLVVERDAPGVPAPCTMASEAPLGSTALSDGLGHLATSVTTVPLHGVFTWDLMPSLRAPALVIGAPGPHDLAWARPAPSAPLWTAPLPAIGASSSCTIISGLAASGHSLSRYPTGCGPTDSQVTVADSAWCQPRGSTHPDIPCRSTVFGRHWFANPSAEECLRVALPETQLQGSSQVPTLAPSSAAAVAFPISPQATTYFAVGDDGQSAGTPRRHRVFECDLDELD